MTGSARTGPVDPRLLRHARDAWPGVAALATLGVVSAAATIAATVSAALLVAALVEHPGALPRTEIAVLAVVVLVRGLVAWAEPVVAARTAGRVVDGLRERVLLALARRGTTPERDGGVVTDLDDVAPWFSAFLPALVVGAVTPPAVLVVLAVTDVPSMLIVAATLPFVPVFAALLGWATRARVRREWAAGERLAGHFLDAVSGLATLRLFGRARRQADEVARTGEAHRRATSSVLRVAFLSTSALELLATVSVGLVAVGAGLRLVEGTIGLGAALVAILLAPEAHRPLREVGARFHETARASAVLAAAEEVLADGVLADGAPAPPPSAARVDARGLRVRFPGRRHDALAPVTLTAEGGEMVAVTGPSGAGKSTLLRVLAGATTGSAGSATVRGHVVVLPQHPTLPHARTVADAIDGGEPVLARLDPAIPPTARLGEGGAGLSTGQRRRVALARALAQAGRDPERTVLLVDEPTAHLDAGAEDRAVTELRRVADAGALVLVVAHRDAPVAAADRVLTLAAAPPHPRAGSPRADGRARAREGSPDAPGAAQGSPRGAWWARFPVARARLAGAAAVVAAVALTAASSWLIVRAHGRPPVLELAIAVVAVRGCAVVRPLLRHQERLLVHDDVLARVVGWRRRLVADLADRVPGPVAGRRGHLLAHLVDDVEVRSDGEVRGRTPLVVAAIALPAVLGAGAWLDGAVALALLVGLAVAAVVAPLLAAWAARRDGPALDDAAAGLRAAVLESLAGREELGPGGVAAAPRRAASELSRARRRAARAVGGTTALAQLGLGAATVGAAAVTAVSAVGTRPETLAVLVLAPLALGATVVALPDAARAAVRGRQARARLDAVGEAPRPARDGGVAPPHGTDLRVRGLVAGWDPATPALDGCDLDLPAGARIAVTGPSGCGKSTLAAVVTRLLDPRGGSVTLGGTELADLDGDAVRRRIALVGEHDHVFATTVRGNLTLAAPGASDAALRAVLARVRLDGWLAGLVDGLDTVVAHDQLSGGERRRLAAARALLVDPDVLVLDEPTEGLDAPTAEALMADLLALGPSVLLLAHRRDGFERVDEVVELGRLRAAVGG